MLSAAILALLAASGQVQNPPSPGPIQLPQPPAAPGADSSRTPQPSGVWRAVLQSPGGPLPFEMHISRLGEDTRHGSARAGREPTSTTERSGTVWIQNGAGHFTVTRDARWLPDTGGDGWLMFSSDDDSLKFVLQFSGRDKTFKGSLTRTRGPKVERFPLNGSAGEQPRFAPRLAEDEGAPLLDLSGRWRVDFEHGDDPAVGIFEVDATTGKATGTFLTSLGDYRFLAGTVDAQGLRLSCVDEGHIFLFHARPLADDPDRLEGHFWSASSWHETWTATRDPDAQLPDPFADIQWTGPSGPKQALTDLRALSYLKEVPLEGAATVVLLVGSWCPNCYDASMLWREYHKRFADRGLDVLSLAFEIREPEEAKHALEIYRANLGLTWPVIYVGSADKKEAHQHFPLISEVKSYPTAIVLDHTGAVRAVHSGFLGPAAGAAHDKLRDDFARLIEQLLDEAETKAKD